jgi:hypothetical protein
MFPCSVFPIYDRQFKATAQCHFLSFQGDDRPIAFDIDADIYTIIDDADIAVIYHEMISFHFRR